MALAVRLCGGSGEICKHGDIYLSAWVVTAKQQPSGQAFGTKQGQIGASDSRRLGATILRAQGMGKASFSKLAPLLMS